MEEVTTVNRTPELIAAEINSIKNQTRNMILCNSIEIGRRLVEAKSLVQHGEWGKWLETSVEYSQSTANNLMRIFEEYGSGQFSLFGDHQAKSQALAKLSYTQAVALLAIPEEEREAFIEQNDVENMSTRELQQAIKERDEAKEEKRRIEEKLKIANEQLKTKVKLEEELAEVRKQLKEAEDSGDDEEIKKLQKSLKETAGKLDASNRKITELERQLQEKPIDVPAAVEKIPEEVQKELETLRKTAGNKTIVEYSVKFEALVKGFKDLLGTLGQLKESDPEQYEQYKGAVLGLISKMQDHLG